MSRDRTLQEVGDICARFEVHCSRHKVGETVCKWGGVWTLAGPMGWNTAHCHALLTIW
jgi:hypothetical protein